MCFPPLLVLLFCLRAKVSNPPSGTREPMFSAMAAPPILHKYLLFGKISKIPKNSPWHTFSATSHIWDRANRGICCVHLIWEEEGWSICFHYLNTIWPPTRCPLKSYMRPSAISLCHLNSKWLETACCLAHDLGWRHQIFYHPFHLIIFSQNRETSKICFN